ncbi:phosphotransferase [Nocardia sp. NPDC049190]|uniref:phosphotransferase enzyme family protein n=1 Tax=Nocardia sp. NPDC049190 TaxID=3155650 RepID=UPI0033D8DAE9
MTAAPALQASVEPLDAVLRRMIAQFSGVPVMSIERMGIGAANDVFRVSLADETRLALRVLRNQTRAGAAQEIELQRALHSHGLPTPLSLRLRTGRVVGDEGGRTFTIAEYVAGTSTRDMSDALARDFGRTLARFHHATTDLTIDHHDALHPDVLSEELDDLAPDDRAEFDSLLTGTSALFTTCLPTANIHGDLHLGNVHVADDRITMIFDLETVEHNVRLLDVAQSALSVAEAAGGDLLQAGNLVLAGYAEIAPVTAAERIALALALRYTAVVNAAWFRVRGLPRAEVHLGSARAIAR